MRQKKSVTLDQLVEKMEMTYLTPEIPTEGIEVSVKDINRPAMQLAGYMKHFPEGRVQIIGLVEGNYIEEMEETKKREAIDRWMALEFPCVVYCRGIMPEPVVLELARAHQKPVYMTEQLTSVFTAEMIRWLNVQLAQSITIHGVLVDVYGIGVLITGESGIGKSEAALELIRRGHRLVGDDAVELRKVSEETLVGTAPELTRHFLELRGIGVIDVKMLFGVERVLEMQSISLVIHLEEWSKDKHYDRIGLEQDYVEYLGKKIPCHVVPVRPGRNVAVIVEAAAINHRQKMMGYNAAEELQKRYEEQMGEV